MPNSHQITGSTLYVTITAAENTKTIDINTTLSELDKQMEGRIYQLFDADRITEPNHIYYAAANAFYAMKNGSNISNRLDVETLLYASAQNQISKAIKLIGVSKKTRHIAIVVISETQEDPAATMIAKYLGNQSDKIFEPSMDKYEALKALFDVTETAINTVEGDRYKALTSLITEKGALISLKR